jgi:hypothetical protein
MNIQPDRHWNWQSMREPARVQEADLQEMRSLSLSERAHMLEAVCAAAMDFQEARAKMGLPPPIPEPWPNSTLELLRRDAPRGRRSQAK